MKPIEELCNLIAQYTPTDGLHSTAVPRLHLIRTSKPTAPFHVSLRSASWTRDGSR